MKKQIEDSKLLTISEVVSDFRRKGFDIESHKLRDYEKKGLLSPERTSKEQRRYSDLDIVKIQRILMFLFLGLSLKKIKNLFDLEEKLEKCWSSQNKECSSQLSLLTKKIDNIYGEIIEKIINLEGIMKEILDVPNDPLKGNLLLYKGILNSAVERLAR